MLATSSPATSRDPTSVEYKKARRHHKRSAQGRTPRSDTTWTPFRAAEKMYKTRFPPPDLSGVLDLAILDDERRDECSRGGWSGRTDAVEWKEIALRGEDATNGRQVRRAYVVPLIPGLVLLPSFLSHDRQRSLATWALSDHARAPNVTNLDTHYVLPSDGLWNIAHTSNPLIVPRSPDPSTPTDNNATGPRQLISNTPASPDTFATLAAAPKPDASPAPGLTAVAARSLLTKLRWANIGWHYHWGTKQYDFARGKTPIDEGLQALCKDAVRTINWRDVFGEDVTEEAWNGESWERWHEEYQPDAGIVNFYQLKDTLMAHVDRSEVCATSPLVSISLGCAAVLLIGGTSRDDEPVPILVRSGDVVIMSGPACRRAYHGVPRILEDTLPPHLEPHAGEQGADWAPFGDYLRSARINVNVRQVFPRGFDPTLSTREYQGEEEVNGSVVTES